jgi:cold shock CspA family protein
MNELDTTVNAARNSLSISILGLQEQINTNQKTMDTRAYGFESKMGDDIRTFRNSMDLQMTGLKKLVDDQRVELNKIQSAISTLGQTLEQSGQSIIRSSRP